MSDKPGTPVRRIVTGHDDNGLAVVASEASFDAVDIPSGDAAFCLVWTAPDLPVDNMDPVDGRDRAAGLTVHGGSVIRIVDMHPGCASPMHRTNSLDYGIVLSGEVCLELDDGSVTRLGSGDIIVQRGTMHLWRNPSPTQGCRIAFVLTAALPVSVAGAELPEVLPA